MKTTTEKKPFLLLTAGCGGSGKSTIRKREFADLIGVDPDEIKKTIKGYDPKNPQRVHRESSIKAKREFFRMLGTGKDFYFDGTGKSIEKYVTLINEAKSAGYEVKLLFVEASLETCLTRNARRERTVPARILTETHALLKISIDVLSQYVDELITVNND